MKLHEANEILLNIYKKEITKFNFYPHCLLIYGYTEEELKQLFNDDDEIAQYLDRFFLLCYDIRELINILGDEFTRLNDFFNRNNITNAFSFVYQYLNCLKEIADNFDKLNIKSLSSKYASAKEQFLTAQKECLDILKYSDFEFGNSKSKKYFEREKEALFEYNSESLKKLENGFINTILKQIDLNSILDIEELIYWYYDLKLSVINYTDPYEESIFHNLCHYVLRKNKNSTNKLLCSYSLVNKFDEIAADYYDKVIENDEKYKNEIYVFTYQK